MVEDFADKLQKLENIINILIAELEKCPPQMIDKHSEEIMSTLYNFTDRLSDVEEKRNGYKRDDYLENSDVIGNKAVDEDIVDHEDKYENGDFDEYEYDEEEE